MSKNILKNNVPVRFGRLSANPSQTENGVIYYNTTDNLFRVYENDQWQNLASRSYVDSVAAGFDPKESVEVATVDDIVLSPAPESIDGIPLVEGDRVLVRAQSDATENGIYKLDESGDLVRTTDFDDGVEVNGGEYVFVKSGDTYAGTAWIVTAPDGSATMGTSPITWTQVSGAGKSLQNAYIVGATITTSSNNGSVTIDGTEKLIVSALQGLDVTESLSVGDGNFVVSDAGNIDKINNISYVFPVLQAPDTGYYLMNDGSGNLTWSETLAAFSFDSESDGQIIRYDGTSNKWVNESPVSTSGSSEAIITTNSSGYLDSSFLQYNVDFGDNVLSGVAAPLASGDAANKGYVDRLTLDIIYGQDEDGSNATITTTSADGSVEIAGSEGLLVTAASGLSVTFSMSVGSGDFAVDASGDITKIHGISYSFPASQAAGADYTLVNDGSGTLSWATLALSGLSDVVLTSVSDDHVIRYNATSGKWENESPISVSSGSSDANLIMKTNASGFLDSSFLAYNMNFGDNVLSGVAAPLASGDAANKGYVDRLTLDIIYGQDDDSSAATITTTSLDGSVEIAGTEGLLVTADKGILLSSASGFMLADATNATKYVEFHYLDSVTLSSGTTPVAAADLGFASITYSGAMVSYRIKDTVAPNHVRVGTLLVSTNGTDVSLTDTYAETSDVGVLWSASIADGLVDLKYVASTSNKTMHAEVRRFLTA